MQASLRPVQSVQQQQTVLRGAPDHWEKTTLHACFIEITWLLLFIPWPTLKQTLRTLLSPWSMHAPLWALHPVHLEILFFHEEVPYQWQTSIFANAHQPSLHPSTHPSGRRFGSIFRLFFFFFSREQRKVRLLLLTDFQSAFPPLEIAAFNPSTLPLPDHCQFSDHLEKSSIHQKKHTPSRVRITTSTWKPTPAQRKHTIFDIFSHFCMFE